MNSTWQDFLIASGARIENGQVAHFGDLASELVAARDESIVSPLTHLGLIECSGDEAQSYLQNQLTSDVNHLAEDGAQHAAWCSAKGRMLASFILYRSGKDYRALLSSDLLSDTLKRLQIYVLRSKVKLADLSASNELIGVSGPKAQTAITDAGLTIPANDLETVTFPAGTVIRLSASRFIVVTPADTAATLWEKLAAHARPAGAPAWTWLDIQNGIARISGATKEEFVPQMVNFDQIGGVSFHKGCYPGQEIIARAKYLGKIKRHLYRIQADSAFAEATAIFSPESPDHPCGQVANSAPAPEGGYTALAVVQENFAEAGPLYLYVSGHPEITALTLVGE